MNVAVLATFIIISAVFFAVLLSVQKHRLHQSYASIVLLLETLIERDNEEIANEIFDSRVTALNIRLEQILEIDDVAGVHIFDSSGELLASAGHQVNPAGLPNDVLEDTDKKSNTSRVRLIDNKFLSLKDNVAFLGERVGEIEILYSLETVKNDQTYILFLFSVVFLALLTGSLVVLNLILSKTIIRPIELLNSSTKRIANGEYDYDLRITGKDEIGMLAKSFDSMRHAIKEKIEHLQTTETILRERERQLSLLTDNMADVISRTDPDTNIIYTSPSTRKIFGYDPQSIIGKPVTVYLHPDDKAQVLKEASLARQEGKDSILLQHRWQHADGHYIWVESSTRLLYGENGESNGAIFGTRDIGERVKLEEERTEMEKQLFQSQKLESIGLLAGGVAHDLNNLLSPILGYTELLLAQPGTDTTAKGRLEQIHKAGIGARDLVRQLLAFGRKQTLDYNPLDVNVTLQKYTELIRRTIPEDIDIKILQSDKVRPIMADHGQIEQVIMNLAVNASDSMPDGGKLTIETDMVTLDHSYAARHLGVKEGDYLMMSVSDTGKGMDERTLSQIFEPFFTTKGNKGTGLGLATVYGIVKQHGGNIFVYSEPDQGTTFKVYLPAVGSVDLAHFGNNNDGESKTLTGTETVLVVEDNPQVLETAKTILTQHGYSVVTAEDGKTALDTLDNYEGKIDLMLTDIVLPKMNGREVYEAAKKAHPHIHVIYMSGYTSNVIAHRGVLDKDIVFIQKPFSVKTLCEKVRDVLDHTLKEFSQG